MPIKIMPTKGKKKKKKYVPEWQTKPDKKKLLEEHHSGIMVDVHSETGELMFVILDQGL